MYTSELRRETGREGLPQVGVTMPVFLGGERGSFIHSILLFSVWKPTPVFLPREFRGERSLVGCCPWRCTESDTTEAT